MKNFTLTWNNRHFLKQRDLVSFLLKESTLMEILTLMRVALEKHCFADKTSMVSCHFVFIILLDFINTSKIFNFKEFLKAVIKFCKIKNTKAKGTVYSSSMLHSRHEKCPMGLLTQIRELTKLLWNRERTVIKFRSVASLLQVVSTLHITCLINSWGRGEGQIINDYRSTYREAG